MDALDSQILCFHLWEAAGEIHRRCWNPNQLMVKLGELMREANNRKWEDLFLFQLKASGIPKPEAQFRFHQERKWSVDFAWPSAKLLVEIEGGVWRRIHNGKFSGGAHSHPQNILRDIEKYNAAVMSGYRVLRFTDVNLKDGSAIDLVKKALGIGEDSKDSSLKTPRSTPGSEG